MEDLILSLFSGFYKELDELERRNTIALYQKKLLYNCQETYFYKTFPGHVEKIKGIMAGLINQESFRQYILQSKRAECEREKKYVVSPQSRGKICRTVEQIDGYLSVLTWDWFVENNCKPISDFCGIDWTLHLFFILYGWYKENNKCRFRMPDKNCPLQKYYNSKGIDLHLLDNYGLLSIPKEWSLKFLSTTKVYDPINDTHVLIDYMPMTFLRFINELRDQYQFDLLLRPNYMICGDGLQDINASLNESVEIGTVYPGCFTELPSLSKLYDENCYSDTLIIQHNATDITFEELLEDVNVDQDEIVTQVVHLQFSEKEGAEVITHIDHEYVFYSLGQYEDKSKKLSTKGEARKKYKTFKIDNALIPNDAEANKNVLYQTLTHYFSKMNLIDEFFGRIK